MKTIITIIIATVSIFLVSNSAFAQEQKKGSKSLDAMMRMNSTTEDSTDDFEGTARRYKKTGEWRTIKYEDSKVRNHYIYASLTGGFDSESSGYESNVKVGIHKRGINAYVSAGVRQMSLDETLDVKALAMQAAVGLQWEAVSTFVEHSRWMAAIGVEGGFHNLDYTPAQGYRWYGFAPSVGGVINIDYKITENFNIGVYGKYTQFKVNNEWTDFETKEIHQSKVDYKTFSAGLTLTWNFGIKIK